MLITARAKERFWASLALDANGCWNWTRLLDHKGYGRYGLGQKHLAAHRFAWRLLVGEIPAGLQLDHLCRNRKCVNPAHLEPVTPRENTLRGNAPAVVVQRTGRCPNGHDRSVVGTYAIRRSTYVQHVCAECQRQAVRRYKARKNAEAA